jgi:hypothetical protein
MFFNEEKKVCRWIFRLIFAINMLLLSTFFIFYMVWNRLGITFPVSMTVHIPESFNVNISHVNVSLHVVNAVAEALNTVATNVTSQAIHVLEL